MDVSSSSSWSAEKRHPGYRYEMLSAALHDSASMLLIRRGMSLGNRGLKAVVSLEICCCSEA